MSARRKSRIASAIRHTRLSPTIPAKVLLTLTAFFTATLLLSAYSLRAAEPVASPAYSALMHGRIEEASTLLHQQLAASPADGQAHLLLCRVALAEELAEPAVDECQKAVAALPTSSEAQMWFGRALGLKASHANPVAAIGLAKRVHAAFERAVQLNPHDLVATSDLGEFYIDAPAFVGGSKEKAAALARSLLAPAPQKAHRLLALLAEKGNSDLTTAEAEYKLAIAAGHAPEAYSDLALFYQRNKRPDDAMLAATQAIAADALHGPVQVDVASILTDAHRAPGVAIAALRAYLGSAHQTDAAPVFKARVQLGKLLAAQGDKTGARYEFTTAAALAPNYPPARKALASL